MDDLKGYEDYYAINRYGDIFSKYCKKNMKHQLTDDGYLWVKLSYTVGLKRNNNQSEDYNRITHKGRIHRLLANQYIPNPDNLPEIDHIDRNKTNNELTNLRWVTRTQNQNNKCSNLTPEQKKISKEKNVLYKAEWAKVKRANMTDEERAQKDRVNNEKSRAYKTEWMRKKRARV